VVRNWFLFSEIIDACFHFEAGALQVRFITTIMTVLPNDSQDHLLEPLDNSKSHECSFATNEFPLGISQSYNGL
jgi:hypothetical protein